MTHSHYYLLSHFSEVPEEEHYALVWFLMKALWGDPKNLYTKDYPQKHVYNMASRQAMSDWLEYILEKALDSNIGDEKVFQRILNLVSVYKIMETCDLAISYSV